MNENAFENFGLDGSMTNIDMDTLLNKDIDTGLSDNWFDTLPCASDAEDFALDKLFSEAEQSETESVVEEQTTEEKADNMMATMGEFDICSLEPPTTIERASSLTVINETNNNEPIEYDGDHDGCVDMYDSDEELPQLTLDAPEDPEVSDADTVDPPSEQDDSDADTVDPPSEQDDSEVSDAETDSDDALNESQGDASLVQECTICMKETENYTEEGRCIPVQKR